MEWWKDSGGPGWRAATRATWHIARVMMELDNEEGDLRAVHFACPAGNPDSSTVEWRGPARDNYEAATLDLKEYVEAKMASHEPRGAEETPTAPTVGEGPATR